MFKERSDLVDYTVGDQGLRKCQVGAIHAISAHFTVHDEPAIVTMPTGSGKTLVMMALPFVLSSERVLIVTPSRVLCNRFSEKFEALDDLKTYMAFPDDLMAAVTNVDGRPKKVDDWEAMRDSHFVVATPAAASPHFAEVPDIPDDLFDLVIFDECHHVPAPTWTSILNQTRNAKQVLFSATPFRLDRVRVPGRHAYTYPLAKALKEKIVAKIEVQEVDGDDGAIAAAALAALKIVREHHPSAQLLVKARTLKRAAALRRVYRDAEGEHSLVVITSDLDSAPLMERMRKLRDGEVDGAIVVDMLGEGVDVPSLKVAALHDSPSSLPVTLQFVGRMSRANADLPETAKVVVRKDALTAAFDGLRREDATWDEIIVCRRS